MKGMIKDEQSKYRKYKNNNKRGKKLKHKRTNGFRSSKETRQPFY